MEAEHVEILNFIKQYAPFTILPEAELQTISQQIEVGYFQKGDQVLDYNQPISDLHVIRSGAIETYKRNGELFNRLSAGGFFGEAGLLRKGRVRYPVKALEDSLIYYVPGALFNRLYDEYDAFADAVEVEEHQRVNLAVREREQRNDLFIETVETLLSRQPVIIESDASIVEAAQKMTDEQVSSLLICGDNPDDVLGIITDKDLRKRVLAVERSPSDPVRDVMSSNLVYIEHNQRIFEAMLTMLRTNLHHLPVLKKQRLIGVIALSDVVRHESKSSLYVVSSIFKQNTFEELAQLKESVEASFVRLVNEDANSRMIGSAMATIGRSFKQRLLELAEIELGPPPIPYCFLALGSMARDEQSIVTDQDNALVLHDDFNPKEHDAYFKALAKFVSDGLHECGYTYCTGGIMATNNQWRQPLRVWKKYFTDWIDNPSPERLLHSSIFFDLDGVWGEFSFAKQLNELIRVKAKNNKRFLGSMARNALSRTPPLGFFKDFVMEKDGKHRDSINTKRRGTAPVADLIRVHALAVGSTQRNSFARLEDIMEANILPKGRGPDLRDALELISMVRIRHQAIALTEGDTPDNNVAPEQLSDFERKNLKDAFQILSNAQKYLRYRYAGG
ncbi:MAG: cyclic nucleotide-binding protein [Idiomarinaceae bacterium]|jgi:CBS domain-containing protein|nr:cyclic nucleotide-binding protein [Idiomarinaceae bacterium]